MSAHRGQKRVLEPIEPESQTAVSHRVFQDRQGYMERLCLKDKTKSNKGIFELVYHTVLVTIVSIAVTKQDDQGIL